MLNVVMLRVTMLSVVMLRVVRPNVVMLSVVILNVVMLSVVNAERRGAVFYYGRRRTGRVLSLL
jgi:hypothetical protein